MNTLNIIDTLEQWYHDSCEWRHQLHQIPELTFELHKTSKYIVDKLTEWNIPVDCRFGKTGVVGIIDGKLGKGQTIAFRIDMDALPMDDLSGKPYASMHKGCSHACGHDGHMTVGLTAAKFLSINNEFKGRVIFLFQPAEEIGAGAKKMMEDGLFDAYPYDEVYGFHNMPRFPSNTLLLRYGSITGASDKFSLTIKGRSGHSSVPHLSINPITIISQIIASWQAIISECIPGAETGVLCVTKLNSGDTFNAIPEQSVAGGTIRYFEDSVRDILKNKMKAIAHGIAASYEAEATLEFETLCFATVNTIEETDSVIEIARDTFGADNVNTQVLPSPGGEDMSFFKKDDSIGSCYFMIGCEGENLHTQSFDFDDSIIPVATTMLVRIAQKRLI